MVPVAPKAAVFIDTSALRKSGLRAAPFQSLLELSKADLVDVFIPEIVFEEQRTQWRDRHLSKLREGTAALYSLLADDVFPTRQRLAAQAALKGLSGIDLEEASKEGFAALFKQNNVNMIPLSIEQVKTAWGHYFGGGGPMTSIKSRNDIPDAHIFVAAQELAGEKNELHCVCHDGALGAALADVAGVSVYPSVDELMQAEFITQARTHWEAERVWLKIEPTLSQRDLLKEVTSYLEAEGGNFLTVMTVDSALIPTSSAKIDWADGGEIVEVDNPDDWGGGFLSFEVAFECDAGISFLVLRDELQRLPSWVRYARSGSYPVQDAEGTVRLYVEGSVTAQIDLERAKALEPPFLANLSFALDSISVHDAF